MIVLQSSLFQQFSSHQPSVNIFKIPKIIIAINCIITKIAVKLHQKPLSMRCKYNNHDVQSNIIDYVHHPNIMLSI